MADFVPSETGSTTASSGTALDAVVFDRLMMNFAPFEASPTIMVGVSGGADSMALCLLAHDWAVARGGKVLAVTVDHDLRSGSANEARWVGDALSKLGIEHIVKRWTGPKPVGAVQEKARDARYRILDDLMKTRGIYHLLVAHHQDDQAETIAMRQQRSTGVMGQAGMSSRRYLRNGRVLRPLLFVAKADLVATLQSRQQDWIEDPSNQNPAFERVRVRQSLATLPDTQTATKDRLLMEYQIGALLARSVTLLPNGVGIIARDPFFDDTADRTAAIYALGQVIRTVRGAGYMPAIDPLSDALSRFGDNPSARISLGGGVLHGRQGQILVYREIGRMDAQPMPITTESFGQTSPVYWDNRFEWVPDTGDFAPDDGLMIGPLELCDVFHTKAFRAALRAIAPFIGNLPRAALASMPALYDKEGLRSVGGLEVSELSDVLSAAGSEWPLGRGKFAFGGRWRFAPQVPMWESGFKLPQKPDNRLA
jgi:tRNA(Ile)-lysidine synthase